MLAPGTLHKARTCEISFSESRHISAGDDYEASPIIRARHHSSNDHFSTRPGLPVGEPAPSSMMPDGLRSCTKLTPGIVEGSLPQSSTTAGGADAMMLCDR